MPSGIYCLLFSGYNSRSPAESDRFHDVLKRFWDATTHALLRRATLMRRHLEGIDLATTHALLRRATMRHSYADRQYQATTHALLRRATPLAVEPLDDALATTHALLRRATKGRENVKKSIALQLTLSCGERLTMARKEEVYYVATTHALLRRATASRRYVQCTYFATTHALLRRATVILTEFVIRCYIKLWELAKSICLCTRI